MDKINIQEKLKEAELKVIDKVAAYRDYIHNLYEDGQLTG